MDGWVFVALIAFGAAGMLVMYGLGFMHGRDAERDRKSEWGPALGELKRGAGPRVMRP